MACFDVLPQYLLGWTDENCGSPKLRWLMSLLRLEPGVG